MKFHVVSPPLDAESPARSDETLMRESVTQGPLASVWHASQALVVPRTYTHSDNFDHTCATFKANGWPVLVRHSGGGVVPQGAGIVNVSMAYPYEGRPLDHADVAYGLLCDVMSSAIAPLGIQASAQAVKGSFCDGRFNLAYTVHQPAQKVAGTAQLWRRQPRPGGGHSQIVLVHALLLVACDIAHITHQANLLEQALGHPRRYLAKRAISLHDILQASIDIEPQALVADVSQRLRDTLTHTTVPV